MSLVRRPVVIVSGVVLAVIAILLITMLVTLRRPLPSYDGSIAAEGLIGKVSVQRDDQGVPQIYASSAKDLFFAQGYVQASDRFFAMDVRRHLASGRLAELIGDRAGAVDSDLTVRTLGWRRVAEQELPLLSTDTRNYLQSFSDGVNAYLNSRSPNELSAGYVVLGTQVDLGRIEPWTPVDSLTYLKATAWDQRGSYDNELGRSLAYGQVSNVKLVNDLFPQYPANAPTIVADADLRTGAAEGSAGSTSTNGIAAQRARAVADPSVLTSLSKTLDSVGGDIAPLGSASSAGSNSWVVGGQHTKSGKPMLALDPHLTASMPGDLYQIGLHCTKSTPECPFQVSGLALPGVPGVMSGHNAKISWSATALPADNSDLFLEQVIGDGYVVGSETKPLVKREETIRIAGGDDRKITVRSTEHGPLLSDVVSRVLRAGVTQPRKDGPVQGDYDVALAWTGLTPGRTMDAIFALDRAGNWEQFNQAADAYDLPPSNLLYADVEHNIGYRAAGRLPTRAGGELGQSTGEWPRLGSDPAWNWTGVVPVEKLPRAFNPSAGYLIAANQPISRSSEITGAYDYGFRAKRIDTLLKEQIKKHKLTADDQALIQRDTHSAFASEVLVPLLRKSPTADEEDTRAQREFTQEGVDLLDDWQGNFDSDSAAAAYYSAVWSNVLRLTFNDQLPDGVAPNGDSRSEEIIKTLARNSQWWDDVSTPTIVENKDQIIAKSLVKARLELTAKLGKEPTRWQWGQLHTMTPTQVPLGSSYGSLVGDLFNGNTVPAPGSSDTINLSAWAPDQGDYQATTISAARLVVDLGNFDASTWVLATGVSGHPWSPHYGDQTETWLEGGSYPWRFSTKAVDESADKTLTLNPSPSN